MARKNKSYTKEFKDSVFKRLGQNGLSKVLLNFLSTFIISPNKNVL